MIEKAKAFEDERKSYEAQIRRLKEQNKNKQDKIEEMKTLHSE